MHTYKTAEIAEKIGVHPTAVCDKLITSLSAAENKAQEMMDMLQKMKIRFS